MDTNTSHHRRLRPLAAFCAAGVFAVALSSCAGLSGGAGSTTDPSATVAPNAEEQRLQLTLPGADTAVSVTLIESSGLAPTVAEFRSGLADAEASNIVERMTTAGSALWTAAVRTAQGENADFPDAAYEDRGLYWARLEMRSDLKKWSDGHPDRLDRLDAALAALEDASRGYDDAPFTSDGARHVMLSGFDPFGDWKASPDLGNPSGSIALRLDGRTIDTPEGPVVFQAVMLPVNWEAFDQGAVERAYAPVLAGGDADADLVITVSQGGFDDFEIEQWAGVWRDGSPDNLDAGARDGFREEIPSAEGFPQPKENAQFIETTLPHAAMIAAATPAYAVTLNPLTCTAPSADRADADVSCDTVAPSSDSFAVAGGGGSFLSNESMYRANRLRLELGRDDIRGGHLHTPLPTSTGGATAGGDSAFDGQRRALVDEAETILLAAAVAD